MTSPFKRTDSSAATRNVSISRETSPRESLIGFPASIHNDNASSSNRSAKRFAQWFRQQPRVIHVNTITDTLKRLNKNLHEDADEWYRVPQQRDLAAQYLLLYEMSLPYGLDLNDQINIDKSATRFIVTTESLSTKDTLEMVERARDWVRANGLNRSGDVEGSVQ